MNRYENAKIYTIRCHSKPDLIYVGSTCMPLSKRLHGHKRRYDFWLNHGQRYISSIEILKNDNYYIELYEDYPCNSKNELVRREGEIIRSVDCVNKRVDGRTRVQYYQDNLETIKNKRRDRYINNREEMQNKARQYYNDTKDERVKQKKEYYTTNKTDILLNN